MKAQAAVDKIVKKSEIRNPKAESQGAMSLAEIAATESRARLRLLAADRDMPASVRVAAERRLKKLRKESPQKATKETKL